MILEKIQFTQSEIDMLRSITSANKREALNWLIYMRAFPDDAERGKIEALIDKLDKLQSLRRRAHDPKTSDFLRNIDPDAHIEITPE